VQMSAVEKSEVVASQEKVAKTAWNADSDY
jgi:hypothetical protein